MVQILENWAYFILGYAQTWKKSNLEVPNDATNLLGSAYKRGLKYTKFLPIETYAKLAI
jgi:hypothetical protein